jgi:hypothetical protein
LSLFQHPRLVRRTLRVPDESLPARVWRRLRGATDDSHTVQVELRHQSTVWVTVAGKLSVSGAEELAEGLVKSLSRRKERLVLDLERLIESEEDALERLADQLRDYADRVRVLAGDATTFGSFSESLAV